jgi:uncharacterized protein (TIGR03067 family)
VNAHLILTAAAALLVAADPAQSKTDAQAILGTWRIVSAQAGGREVPDDQVPRDQVTFEEKTYTQKNPDGKNVEEGEYVLDAGKSPKTMDMIVKTGQYAGKKQLCVYELDGDTLKVCAAEPGDDDRPTALDTKAGDRATLFRLKRVKP